MNELVDFLNKDIKPLKVDATFEEAQELFLDLSYSHFPVSEDEVYIGCIRKEDVETANTTAKIGAYRYDFERFFVREKMIWLDVLEEFAKNEANVMPVLNESNQYVGYYELEDVVKYFYESPFLKEEGGIIIVQKNVSDYSFSEISQIIESNNAKILGLFISNSNAEKVEITIKFSQSYMNEILQSFRRYNYEIVSEHQEDSYLKNLKERSDYLDKYLNI